MSRPDFTQYILDRLAANWQTSNVDPQPLLVDQRDSEQQGTGYREKGPDLAEHNIVTVGTQPTTTNEPIGSRFNYRYSAGVNVRIEAVHESESFADQDGGVAGGPAFEALVQEVRRIILADRVNPTTDDRCRHLTITDENDLSADEFDYYRTDLTVEFFGYEDLS